MIEDFFKSDDSKGEAPDEKQKQPHLFKFAINPKITMGSIVLFAILKTAIVLLLSWFLLERYRMMDYWWISLLAIFIIAIYPALRQYKKFSEESEVVEKESLCATCKHFNSLGIICNLYDEHIAGDYVPCEGLEWQPKPSAYKGGDP